jgi:Putative transposase
LCASCGAKRATQLAAFRQDEIVKHVGHAQWVFTVPKMLRVYFLHGGGRGREGLWARAGIGGSTFGDRANFHPHVHALVSRGGWTASGQWIPVPYVDECASLQSRPSRRWARQLAPRNRRENPAALQSSLPSSIPCALRSATAGIGSGELLPDPLFSAVPGPNGPAQKRRQNLLVVAVAFRQTGPPSLSCASTRRPAGIAAGFALLALPEAPGRSGPADVRPPSRREGTEGKVIAPAPRPPQERWPDHEEPSQVIDSMEPALGIEPRTC